MSTSSSRYSGRFHDPRADCLRPPKGGIARAAVTSSIVVSLSTSGAGERPLVVSGVSGTSEASKPGG